MMQQKKSSDEHVKTYGSGPGKEEVAAPLTKCLPPEVTPKKPRKNGWQRPWNVSLVCLLVIPIMLAVAFLGSFPLCIPFVWRPATYVIFTSLFLIFFINFLISASINAAEPNVANFWGKKKPKIFPKFKSATSRDSHLTLGRISGKGGGTIVERNNYCYICDAYVGLGAKHCGQCNKCVEKFDHHCKWLNNCVGHRNYRYFIFALVSGILLLLIMVAASTTMILVSAFYPKTLKKWIASNANTYKPNYSPSEGEESTEDGLTIMDAVVPDAAFYVFHSVLLVVGAVVLCFTGHLLIFHIYLNYKSMTTYDYIVRQRRRQQQMKALSSSSSTAPPSARETEHEGRTANHLSATAVSNITDNPAYDDFSEVGEEVDVLDSIQSIKPHEVTGASDGTKYHNDETHDARLEGLGDDEVTGKDLMGFEAADSLSYCGDGGTLSHNGSSYALEGCLPGKENPAGQGGIMVSASAYFRTESLLSASETTLPKGAAGRRPETAGDNTRHGLGVEGDGDCEDKAFSTHSEDEAHHKRDQEEELLSEIPVHDTYNGALSNHLFLGIKMM